MVLYDNKNFLEYMADVRTCDDAISALNDQWDNIKLLCEINCPTQASKILPNMTNVQKNFYALQQKLVDTLISETLNKMKQKTISKAQVAIDILVRNLYERTADVGFIATDNDISRFVTASNRDEQKDYILNRLREYVAKYSVYDEIILLDTDGQVLINLDQDNPITGQTLCDRVLDLALASNASFVEHFCPTVLQKHKDKAHIFTSKIADESGETIGVVCLCFRFDDEVEKIFQKLSNDYDGSVILMIDEDNRVLASSDRNHIPVGLTMEVGNPGENNVVYYRGLEYISQTIPTKGYQGYVGQGWKGCIMIPLQLAFREKKAHLVKNMNSDTLAGLMSKADSFSEELQQIVLQTEQINHSLKQIVFNGQLLAHHEGSNDEYSRLKPLLNSIGRIGVSTRQLFEKSIQNLFATVISTSLDNASFLASLAVDIMDRNLYERSDDCRWWALNPTFREILSKEHLDEEDRKQISKVLSYINRLYTVYTNLFIFDKTGKIIAVSNPEYSNHIGLILTNDYIRQVLGNFDPEHYFVSPFEKTELYDNRYTYIYGASITDSLDARKIVGGIGIVFDSEFQFTSMLNDAIDTKENAFAVFTDRNKNVISSTSQTIQIGGTLDLPSRFFEIANGISCSDILELNQAYYAVGCACSSSYREYKSRDQYENDVLAFVFDRLSEADSENVLEANIYSIAQSEIMLSAKEPHFSMATFLLEGHMFSLERSVILETIDTGNIVQMPGVTNIIRGAVIYNNQFISVIHTRLLLGMEDRSMLSPHLLIIQIPDGIQVALEVDELGDILEINESDIKPVPQFGPIASIIKGIYCIRNEAKRAVLQMNEAVLLEKITGSVSRDELEHALQLAEELYGAN